MIIIFYYYNFAQPVIIPLVLVEIYIVRIIKICRYQNLNLEMQCGNHTICTVNTPRN